MTAWTAWSDWPLIHDAAFYAVAVPAVLMMGLSKSGFLGGFGSLAVPLMALVIPVPQAAAIMLPLLLVMDATGLQQLWRHCDRALLRWLLPAGLLGTVVGTLLFGVLSPATVAAVVGALTLLFLAQRLVFPPRAHHPPPPLLVPECPGIRQFWHQQGRGPRGAVRAQQGRARGIPGHAKGAPHTGRPFAGSGSGQ